MDNHLNLFYSYDAGSRKDLERRKQLENNLTRAFILTLKNLSPENRRGILKSLLGEDIGKKELYFELQSVDDKTQLSKLQDCRKKYVIVIQSSKNVINKDDIAKAPKYESFSRIENYLEEQLEMPVKERVCARLRKHLSDSWRKLKESNEHEFAERRESFINGLVEILENKNNHFEYSQELNRSIVSKESLLNFIEPIFETYRGSIPDAWIYNDDMTILVEAKVGSNPVNPFQVQRHLNHKNGMNIKLKKIQDGEECKEYKIKCLTWEKLFDDMQPSEVKSVSSEKDIFLIEQFKQYIIMNNEKLDLSFIVKKGEGYKRKRARELFPVLLDKLDEKIKNDNRTRSLGLVRSNRPKSDYLWDFYGVEKNGKVSPDPHYSVSFDRSGAEIELTTKKEKQIKKLLKSNNLRSFIQDVIEKNSSRALRSRFAIGLHNYKLIDRKVGQQKGETFSTFAFSINFFELQNDSREIESLLKDMEKYAGLAKQIGISFNITYPDVTKIKEKQSSEENKNQSDEASIRKLNRDLFEDYDRLLQCFVDFIDQTNPLFTELNSKV
jgi:hypothetical protein